MNVGRRFSLLLTAALLAIALMLGGLSERPAVSANAARELDRATSYFDTTIVLARVARPQGPRGDQLAIALGYLERMRIGLSEPFRLVDEALVDPRLSTTMKNRVAWALLGRLRRGDAYVVDPIVLDGIGPWTADGQGATGLDHLALIEHTVVTADDPRAGELAIRLAYLVAAAKGTVSSAAPSIATSVAALIRDRESAERDLRDLLADANEERADVLEKLGARRVARSFRVEQPGLAPLSSDVQVAAMRAVPSVVRALDTLERIHEAASPHRPQPAKATAPVIGPSFAARLAVLGAARPPVAQIVVTLGGFAQVLDDASNEETLAAAGADLALAPDSVRRAQSLALLTSAVAVRTLAQEAPWFPGMTGPSTSDLVAEFRLSGLSFARSVPMAWRPYYVRELQTGLRDMLRVFPAQSFSGLGVRFGADVLLDSALALHDPRTRTLQLSIATSGGTIAHELSHDIDWQASRRTFASGGGYNSDRVVREHGGALANSLRSLGEARPFRPFNGAGTAPPSDRPAELFARGADWFVASVLAREGRMNGFLSAIGDGSLTGYAAGPPTAIGAAATTSLVSAIDAMAYVPDSTRASFEAAWSDPRTVDPVLLVRRALETPIVWRPMYPWRIGADSLLPSAVPVLCLDGDSPELRARKDLLITVIDARAKGIALRRARFRPPAARMPWANSLLGVAPWSPEIGERMLDGLRASIAATLTTTLSGQGVLPLTPPVFRSGAEYCSSIPR